MASNCLICFSASTGPTSGIDTLMTSPNGRPLKEFLLDCLAIDVSEECQVLICVECTERLNSLEEAINRAQEIKDRLLNDFNNSAEQRAASKLLMQIKNEELMEDVAFSATDTAPASDDNDDADYYPTLEEDVTEQSKEKTKKKGRPNKCANKKDSDKLLKCDACGNEFKSRSALNFHIKTKHMGDGQYECNFCQKRFTRKGYYRVHLKIHTRETLYQCDLCGKEFIHYSSFKNHKFSHLDIRKKECTVCERKFRCTSHLNKHMRTHTGEKPFTCPVCDRTFADKHNMLFHHRNMHNGNDKRTVYNCVICTMTFNQKHKLNHHLKSVHESVTDDVFNEGMGTTIKNRRKIL